MRCDRHKRNMDVGYRCGVRIYLRVIYQSLWITVSRMMWDTLYPNMHIHTTLDLDVNHQHRNLLLDHLTPVFPSNLSSIVCDYSFSVRRDQEFSTPDFNGFLCQNILLSELQATNSILCRVTLALLHCGCACSLHMVDKWSDLFLFFSCWQQWQHPIKSCIGWYKPPFYLCAETCLW